MTVRRTHSDAFTLTEMLVVISIIAMIMGIGTAFVSFSQSKYQLQSTANGIISTLRTARSEAISSGAPVQVEVHKPKGEEGRVISFSETEVASWEFDEKKDVERDDEWVSTIVPGSLGQKLKCGPHVRFALGTVGGALEFRNDSSEGSKRNGLFGRCEHAYNLNQGVSEGFIIRFSYWADEIQDEIAFIAKKNLFSFGLTQDGRFAAAIGDLNVASNKPFPSATWTDVRIMFRLGRDGPDRMTVYQNGTKIADVKGDANLSGTRSSGPVPKLDSNAVQIGVYPGAFSPVRLDRLRYTRIIQDERATIPKPILVKGDRQVTFFPDGSTKPKQLDLSRNGMDRFIRLRVLETGGIERIFRNESSGPASVPSATGSPTPNSSSN